MPESILSPSQIKLFGRLFDGLTLNPPSEVDADPNLHTDGSQASPNAVEQNKERERAVPDARFDLLTNQLVRNDAKLARIYGFTYGGEYIPLPEPAVFLVHGVGRAIDKELSGLLDRSGVAARDWSFESDISYWEYDRVNYSLRCDIVTGTLEDLLGELCGASDENEGAADVGARAFVSSRAFLSARSKLNTRSDLNARHRVR